MQAVLWADIITLAAEYALGHPYPDSFCLRNELNGIGRTNPDTHLTPDTCVPVIHNFPPVFFRSRNWRVN